MYFKLDSDRIAHLSLSSWAFNSVPHICCKCGSQECEIAVAEPNAMGVQLDAERADFLVQLEHLKGQVNEKECKVQDIEEQVKKM